MLQIIYNYSKQHQFFKEISICRAEHRKITWIEKSKNLKIEFYTNYLKLCGFATFYSCCSHSISATSLGYKVSLQAGSAIRYANPLQELLSIIVFGR